MDENKLIQLIMPVLTDITIKFQKITTKRLQKYRIYPIVCNDWILIKSKHKGN